MPDGEQKPIFKHSFHFLNITLLSFSMASRWTNDNPNQGSAFHELVVLPTLAPQLARPYHAPGTAEHLANRLEEVNGTAAPPCRAFFLCNGFL